jgi:amidase
MTSLCFRSAVEIAAAIRRREISSLDCLEYFRGRVERFNPAINAIVVFDWDRARAAAREADRALAADGPKGPLHGVPMTVKESFDVAGLPTTHGDPSLRQVPSRDDLIIERLKAAGAVIFGKTNVPFQLLDLQTYNDIYGVTNNPWDHTRTPGGSSGGAAAATAAGLTALELGSDIGGSIRNPAHQCGVFGHKPTFNIVGADRLALPPLTLATDLCVAGPLARSAEDLALSMQLLAAPGRLDDGVQVRLREPRKALKDYRVAIWATDEQAPVQRQISDRCQLIADRLAALGAKVSDKARPAFASAHAGKLYRTLLNASTDAANELKHRDWRLANEERIELRRKWREFFGEWDIVVSPICATTAFKHNHGPYAGRTLQVDDAVVPYFKQLFWAGLATCSYLPATAFPTGPGSDGLPIGLQAIGDAYNDSSTIGFAGLLARELGGFRPPPGYAD